MGDDDDDDPIDRLRKRLGIRPGDDAPPDVADPADASGSFAAASVETGEPGRIPLKPAPPPESDDDDEILPETERFAPESAEDLAIDVEKVCRICGKNLKGHRRYKDDKGYLCATCEKDDRARRLPCAECGKPTLPESLRPWGPISICARCFADHEADPKSRVKKKISTKNFELAEKQNLLILSGVAFVLLCVMLLSWGGCIGG